MKSFFFLFMIVFSVTSFTYAQSNESFTFKASDVNFVHTSFGAKSYWHTVKLFIKEKPIFSKSMGGTPQSYGQAVHWAKRFEIKLLSYQSTSPDQIIKIVINDSDTNPLLIFSQNEIADQSVKALKQELKTIKSENERNKFLVDSLRNVQTKQAIMTEESTVSGSKISKVQ